MKNLNNDFKVLTELLRTAYKLISPITYHDDLKRLSPQCMQQDFEKRPGCYLKIGTGRDHTLFPICNRYGFKDPDIIRFSLKMARSISDKNIDVDDMLNGAIIKLERLLDKYDKPSPKTISQAILKGKSTKDFNNKMGFKDMVENINDANAIAQKKLEDFKKLKDSRKNPKYISLKPKPVDESEMVDHLVDTLNRRKKLFAKTKQTPESINVKG